MRLDGGPTWNTDGALHVYLDTSGCMRLAAGALLSAGGTPLVTGTVTALLQCTFCSTSLWRHFVYGFLPKQTYSGRDTVTELPDLRLGCLGKSLY